MMKLFQLLIVPFVAAGVVRTHQQIPIVADVVQDGGSEVAQPNAKHVAEEVLPMVGIHFTTSYAVASVRYPNGTLVDLARVPGDAEYIDIMSRYTAEWPHDIYQNSMASDCFKDTWHFGGLPNPEQRLKRHECIRALLGKSDGDMTGVPLPQDVTTLTAFMSKVRKAIEIELDASIPDVAITIPRMPFYLQEEFQEPLKLAELESARAKLELIDTAVYEESNAAYAGYGYGHCRAKFEDCSSELNWQEYEHVLYLNFDNSSFSTGMMALQNAYQTQRMFTYAADTKLGWWNLPVFEVPRTEFWARIHEMITTVLEAFPEPIHKVVLLGDHGAEEEFKEVVKAAVWEVHEFDVETLLSVGKKEDVTYLAARGAAELEWHMGELSRKREADRPQ